MKKALPIGYDNFKEIIAKDLYYVDKTLMIKDILDKDGKVNLFTRPRRFGKTLTLSMLRAFFEQDMDTRGNFMDHRDLFQGMRIMDAGEKYVSKMGQYPVIFLSLKSGKQPDFEMAYQCLVDEVIKEYDRHSYVLLSDKLLNSVKERYRLIMEGKAEPAAYAKGLAFLSSCLKEVHGKNTIILIDEYDVPLENAHFAGFYDEMIGFTQQEVEELLRYYDLEDKLEEARDWYNGYLFGNTQVYNPWSMINYVKTLCSDRQAFPKPYWSNTSSNSIVRELVEASDDKTKSEIEDRNYAAGYLEEGYRGVVKYAFCFCKKSCRVKYAS